MFYKLLKLLLTLFFTYTFTNIHLHAASSLRLAFLPGSDALEEVIEEIKRARVRIDLGLFYLTHDAIIDALCYKASQKNARGQRLLKVRIYVDATIKDECCGDENEGKIWDGDESKQCCCGDELKDKDGKDLDCDKFLRWWHSVRY